MTKIGEFKLTTFAEEAVSDYAKENELVVNDETINDIVYDIDDLGVTDCNTVLKKYDYREHDSDMELIGRYPAMGKDGYTLYITPDENIIALDEAYDGYYEWEDILYMLGCYEEDGTINIEFFPNLKNEIMKDYYENRIVAEHTEKGKIFYDGGIIDFGNYMVGNWFAEHTDIFPCDFDIDTEQIIFKDKFGNIPEIDDNQIVLGTYEYDAEIGDEIDEDGKRVYSFSITVKYADNFYDISKIYDAINECDFEDVYSDGEGDGLVSYGCNPSLSLCRASIPNVNDFYIFYLNDISYFLNIFDEYEIDNKIDNKIDNDALLIAIERFKFSHIDVFNESSMTFTILKEQIENIIASSGEGVMTFLEEKKQAVSENRAFDWDENLGEYGLYIPSINDFIVPIFDMEKVLSLMEKVNNEGYAFDTEDIYACIKENIDYLIYENDLYIVADGVFSYTQDMGASLILNESGYKWVQEKEVIYYERENGDLTTQYVYENENYFGDIEAIYETEYIEVEVYPNSAYIGSSDGGIVALDDEDIAEKGIKETYEALSDAYNDGILNGTTTDFGFLTIGEYTTFVLDKYNKKLFDADYWDEIYIEK